MDRSATPALDHPTSVRSAGSAPRDLLPPAAAAERGESASDAAARRAISGVPLLRQSSHGGHVGGEPQTHPATLMGIMGIEALYPKPNFEPPGAGSRDLPVPAARNVDRAAQPRLEYRYYQYPMRGGFLYLVAVMDWFSRFVLSRELSNTMETGFCLAALQAALRFGQPEIWNSDQGSQFTAADFLALKQRGIRVSMDGRGRALDNVFIERLWRSLQYELVYPGDFASGADLYPALDRYFRFIYDTTGAPVDPAVRWTRLPGSRMRYPVRVEQ